jgi:hypothetical protein
MDINVVFSLVPRHFSSLTVTNPWATAAFTSAPATGAQVKKRRAEYPRAPVSKVFDQTVSIKARKSIRS